MMSKSAELKVLQIKRLLCALHVVFLLASCTAEEKYKEYPFVCHAADDALIGFEKGKTVSESEIVSYEGKPVLRRACRDAAAISAVQSYCKWKGSNEIRMPVKVAVGTRFVTQWSAITLPSGDVFVAGGAFFNPTSVINQTWILEPKTSRLRDGPQLLRSRTSCTLTLLSSGKVLISGGHDGQARPLSECETFDPKTESVSSFSPMVIPREAHAVIETDDRSLLVFGGETTNEASDSTGSLISVVEEWKPDGNCFRIVGRMYHPRLVPMLYWVGSNRVLITGGKDFALDGDIKDAWTNEIYQVQSTQNRPN